MWFRVITDWQPWDRVMELVSRPTCCVWSRWCITFIWRKKKKECHVTNMIGWKSVLEKDLTTYTCVNNVIKMWTPLLISCTEYQTLGQVSPQKGVIHWTSGSISPFLLFFFLFKPPLSVVNMAAAAARSKVVNVLKVLQSGAGSCPCHSHAHSHNHLPTTKSFNSLLSYGRNFASANESTDYAFEMAASNIRFGPGVTR